MTENDVLIMLIEVYELGLAHGREQGTLDRRQKDAWYKTKDNCLANVRELTKL